jgi:hypothetical protein
MLELVGFGLNLSVTEVLTMQLFKIQVILTFFFVLQKIRAITISKTKSWQ